MNGTEAALATPAEAQTGHRERGTALNGDKVGAGPEFASDVTLALVDATDPLPAPSATRAEAQVNGRRAVDDRHDLGGAHHGHRSATSIAAHRGTGAIAGRQANQLRSA
jgi:hypothetical protein